MNPTSPATLQQPFCATAPHAHLPLFFFLVRGPQGEPAEDFATVCNTRLFFFFLLSLCEVYKSWHSFPGLPSFCLLLSYPMMPLVSACGNSRFISIINLVSLLSWKAKAGVWKHLIKSCAFFCLSFYHISNWYFLRLGKERKKGIQ